MILGKEEEVERGLVFLEKLGFMWVIFMLFGGTLIQILYTCKNLHYIVYISKIKYCLWKLKLWKFLVCTNPKTKAVVALSDNDRARNVSYGV